MYANFTMTLPSLAIKCFEGALQVTWKNPSCMHVLENSWLGEGTSVFNGFCPTSLGSQMERKGDKKGRRGCVEKGIYREKRHSEKWLITLLMSEFRLWKWITHLTGCDSREPVFGSFDCSRYYKYFTGFISPERRAGRASHRSKFT